MSGAQRPVVDVDECIGTGMCVKLAPAVFELCGEGHADVLAIDLSDAHQQETIADAAACCPVEAIRLEPAP